MSDIAILIEGVSKTYQRGKVIRGDIRNSLSIWRSGIGREKEEFYALKDIDLSVKKGEVIGIVGPNGAGKSTLLKLLSQITFPTKGRMSIYGTLSSMLEVGTGFHPELTGRENIFLNGAIIGMRREEVNRKLDSIIAFSGLEDFLETPVKQYSSGMYVRLAFAVASHLEPDILLIDEVLAVGDQEFRKKCIDKLIDVSGQGRTIIVVSHQMSYLKELCQTGCFLNAGSIAYHGPIDDTINHYVNYYSDIKNVPVKERKDRRGSGLVRLTGFDIQDDQGYPMHVIPAGHAVNIRLTLEATTITACNVVIELSFYDTYGQLCFLSNNLTSDSSLPEITGSHSIACHIPKFPLNTNIYFINAAIYVSQILSDEVLHVASIEVGPGLFYKTGKLPPPNKGFLVDYYWA